jgi:hypothetical protein
MVEMSVIIVFSSNRKNRWEWTEGAQVGRHLVRIYVKSGWTGVLGKEVAYQWSKFFRLNHIIYPLTVSQHTHPSASTKAPPS